MAALTVRNLEDEVVRQLRIRAAEHALRGGRTPGDTPLGSDGHAAALTRQQAAESLAEFRRRTAGRGLVSSAELLAESRAERLCSLAGKA
jgi:antitoxin FitA